MTPKLIKTSEDYERVLERISDIIEAEEGTPEFDELELLVKLVEIYEEEKFVIEKPEPVAAIKFRMEQQGLKNQDLVPFIGSKSKVSEVLSGKRSLSLNMIRKLSKGLDIPLEILIKEPKEQKVDYSVLDYFNDCPFTEMFNKGWFKSFFSGVLKEAKEKRDEIILKFVGPLNIQNFAMAYNRKSEFIESKNSDAALMAWRIRVMNIASEEHIAEWDKSVLTKGFFSDLVNLSYLKEGPKLAKEFLNKAGIYFVVQEHLTGSHLDGCSMLMPDGHPLIALTLRYDRIDSFWFTLFHELAHVKYDLSESNTAYFDDMTKEMSKEIEIRADRFANDMLISEKDWDSSHLSIRSSSLDVIEFANRLRISPAIPAGRLRFQNKNYSVFTNLVGNGEVRKLFVSMR